MTRLDLDSLAGSRWIGDAELWVDPLGDEVERSTCSMRVDSDGVRWTWQHAGASHDGQVLLRADHAEFRDTWHQPEPMRCARLADAGALFQIRGSYGPDQDWGWRVALCLRTPTGQLVLQMTNIAPWGEEARAVRMTCERQSES